MNFQTHIIKTHISYINLEVKQSLSPFGPVINHNPKAMETVVLKTIIEFKSHPKEPIVISMIDIENSFQAA